MRLSLKSESYLALYRYGSLGSRSDFYATSQTHWGRAPVPHSHPSACSPLLPLPHLFEIPATSLQSLLAVYKGVARSPPQLHEELLAGSRGGQPGPSVKCMPRLGRLKQKGPHLEGVRKHEKQEAARSSWGGSTSAGRRP